MSSLSLTGHTLFLSLPPSSTIPQHVNFDPDLYSHILCLCGSHLPPGRLLVVVHLVAYWLLPVDGFGLEGIKTERDLKLVSTNKQDFPESTSVPRGRRRSAGVPSDINQEGCSPNGFNPAASTLPCSTYPDTLYMYTYSTSVSLYLMWSLTNWPQCATQ